MQSRRPINHNLIKFISSEFYSHEDDKDDMLPLIAPLLTRLLLTLLTTSVAPLSTLLLLAMPPLTTVALPANGQNDYLFLNGS